MKRIYVSDNRRFLVDADGAPFFWLGDTAWELFHRCSLAEAELYLANRRQKGFTVIQAAALAELDGLHTPNANGDLPLLDDDPLRPNEPYWRHVDAVIALAAQKGLYIGLLPTWGDKVNLMWGVGPQVFDAASARAYGEFVGRRYREAANVIWIMGGDRPEVADGVDYAPVWRALAAGVKAGVGGHTLMTYHPKGGEGSSQTFHNDDWLDLNMWQSGHMQPDLPNWEMITQDYQRTPVKPVLDGEPNYEDHPIGPYHRQWQPEHGYFDAYDVRKQAYRAVFAGACGHTYGHHSIWQMYDQGREPKTFPLCTWKEALDRPGAAQMIHLRRLLESRPYLNRVPDQSLLLTDPGAGGQHIRATRADDGSYALVYVPDARRDFQLDARRLSGAMLRCWWYDPRTGAARPIGEQPRSGALAFTTPDNGPDWVLAVDDAEAGFAAPGTRPQA